MKNIDKMNFRKKSLLSYIKVEHSKMFDKIKLRVSLSAKLGTYLLFILITFSLVIYIADRSYKQIYLVIFTAEEEAKTLDYSSKIRSEVGSILISINKYVVTNNDLYQLNYKNQYLKIKAIHEKLKKLELSKEETKIIDSIEVNIESIDKYANLIFQDKNMESNNDKVRYLKILDYNIESKLYTSTNDISIIAIRNIGVQRNKLEIKLSQVSERIVLALLLSILFSLILAHHLWHRFVKPIKALSDATEALRKGNKIGLLKPSGHDEIASLTRSFKRMNKSIGKSQKNLIEMKQHFIENIFASIPSGIMVIGQQLDTIYANQCFFELFDLRQQQYLSISIDELIQKKILPIEIKEEIIGKYAINEIEFPFHYKGKGDLTYSVRLSEILNSREERLLIFNNITEKKKVFDELIIAKEKAQESDRLKSAFLANMSHEIRTPLNGIIGFADLLQDQSFDVIQRNEFTRLIGSNGEHLLNILNDILDISRIEAGQVQVKRDVISGNELITEIQNEFSNEANMKGIEIRLKSTSITKEFFFNSDKQKLKQILTNFVSNAFKFTKNGYIELGIRIKEDFIQFHVRDTGIGIPKEYQDIIFERFRQVEAADTRNYGGNGLGLAISKGLTELLGGKIWVESTFGEGSTFYLLIPISQKDNFNILIK
jgi:signal transduction histidine kinase